MRITIDAQEAAAYNPEGNSVAGQLYAFDVSTETSEQFKEQVREAVNAALAVFGTRRDELRIISETIVNGRGRW